VLGSLVRHPSGEASPPAGYATLPARDEGETHSPSPRQTDCCIVGGGPAGVVLGLLLAREGVSVTLLEARKDFDREFRGNTISPSVMEVMGELGLANRLLELRHAEIPRFTIQVAGRSTVFADFRRLKTLYPYVLMIPQTSFLELIAAEARRCPNFRIVMGARVKELIEEEGVVRGVRYRTADGPREVRATLTVGADGRFSQVRRLAGLKPVEGSPPMDVFWFRLPRKPDDPDDASAVFRFGAGSLLVLMDHFDHWQVGYIIRKDGYRQLRAAGLPALRRSVAELAPELADRVGELKDWKQGSLLSVESDRLQRWYRPGLLLIGDAAHVASPVGGVGINLAIQDAVVAANVLAEPLKAGRLRSRHLKAVQRRREWPTRLVRWAQVLAERWVVSGALDASETFRLSIVLRFVLRSPLLRDLFARLVAFGAWPVHVRANAGDVSACQSSSVHLSEAMNI
jgi:2-polyprenyl-6-methoxyphenol hydroxylase-like FAD-dependent oxidoreductase